MRYRDVQCCCNCSLTRWLCSQIIVQAEGYEPQAKLVQVSNGHKEATRLDFDLVETEAEAGGEDGNTAAADWMVYNDLMAQVD